MPEEAATPAVHADRVVGRYRIYDEIAAGGMASVHLGRLVGPVGFSRTVAVKQLHAQFAKDPEFVSMFLDEARLAARIHHPNVVPTLDVVATKGELFLIMEYVHGETLSRLLRASPRTIAPKVLAAIIAGALHGLHAAHEAHTEKGVPLGIVHRDVSPQNIIVGVDGVPRVLDFGVAKANDRLQTTGEGRLKGKIRYMAPEQITGTVTRLTDVYATAVVLHEALTGRSLFAKSDPGAIVNEILTGTIQPPSATAPEVSSELDAIVMRGLARKPEDRFKDAREMALALEETVGLASASQVGSWVSAAVSESLSSRASMISLIEHDSSDFEKPVALAEIRSVPPEALADAGDVVAREPGSGSIVASQISFIAQSVSPPPSRKRAALWAGIGIGVAGILSIAAFGVSRIFANHPAAIAPADPSNATSAERATPSAPIPSESSSAVASASASATASADPAALASSPRVASSSKPKAHPKPAHSNGAHPSSADSDEFRTRE